MKLVTDTIIIIMKKYKQLNPTNINFPIRIADTFRSRLIGLMGLDQFDYGLLIIPCKSIHTFFMKVAIDVIFLDKNFVVIDIRKAVAPWKAGIANRKAASVLELPAGYAGKLQIIVGKPI